MVTQMDIHMMLVITSALVVFTSCMTLQELWSKLLAGNYLGGYFRAD